MVLLQPFHLIKIPGGPTRSIRFEEFQYYSPGPSTTWQDSTKYEYDVQGNQLEIWVKNKTNEPVEIYLHWYITT